MISFHQLPTLNAVLNGATACCLIIGYFQIRKKRILAHRIWMSFALLLSIVFLTSYLIYHYQMGTTKFPGTGWIRPVYFSVLFTHTVLAVMVPPLAIVTVVFALRNQLSRHRKIARWTLPIWLYVSITGVTIYWLLYHAYAPLS